MHIMARMNEETVASRFYKVAKKSKLIPASVLYVGSNRDRVTPFSSNAVSPKRIYSFISIYMYKPVLAIVIYVYEN